MTPVRRGKSGRSGASPSDGAGEVNGEFAAGGADARKIRNGQS